VLVPLTPSLYVPGKLTETGVGGRVVVDVGTGFFAEKVGCCCGRDRGFAGVKGIWWADLRVGVGTGAGEAVLYG